MDKTIAWDKIVPYYDAHAHTEYDFAFFTKWAQSTTAPVLELMCGTGRLALPLIREGVDYWGLDSAPSFLQKAQQKLQAQGLLAHLICADARNFELNLQFGLIFIAFHAFAELIDPEDRRQVLRRICRHLQPDGACILTLHNPTIRIKSLSAEPVVSGPFMLPETGGSVEVTSTWRTELSSGLAVGEQRYVEWNRDHHVAKTVTLPITFALIELEEVEEMAQSVGFQKVHLFGDYEEGPFEPLRSPHMIFIFRPA